MVVVPVHPVSVPLVPKPVVNVGVVSPVTGVMVTVGAAVKDTVWLVVQLFAARPFGETVKLTVPVVAKLLRSEKVSLEAAWLFVPVKMIGAADGEIPRFETPGRRMAAAGGLATIAAPPTANSPVTSATKHMRRRKIVKLTSSLAF